MYSKVVLQRRACGTFSYLSGSPAIVASDVVMPITVERRVVQRGKSEGKAGIGNIACIVGDRDKQSLMLQHEVLMVLRTFLTVTITLSRHCNARWS